MRLAAAAVGHLRDLEGVNENLANTILFFEYHDRYLKFEIIADIFCAVIDVIL
jgi:hypothetical protein